MLLQRRPGPSPSELSKFDCCFLHLESGRPCLRCHRLESIICDFHGHRGFPTATENRNLSAVHRAMQPHVVTCAAPEPIEESWIAGESDEHGLAALVAVPYRLNANTEAKAHYR